MKNMSVNIRSQNRKTTNDSNKNNDSNFIHSIVLRYFDKSINNKRYSNSSKKNNIYIGKEEDDEIDKLNNIYLSKEREYNNLVSQYKEILDCLNQKKEFLYQNKSKYQTLLTNNNNMKMILLKLLKIKGNKLG